MHLCHTLTLKPIQLAHLCTKLRSLQPSSVHFKYMERISRKASVETWHLPVKCWHCSYSYLLGSWDVCCHAKKEWAGNRQKEDQYLSHRHSNLPVAVHLWCLLFLFIVATSTQGTRAAVLIRLLENKRSLTNALPSNLSSHWWQCKCMPKFDENEVFYRHNNEV